MGENLFSPKLICRLKNSLISSLNASTLEEKTNFFDAIIIHFFYNDDILNGWGEAGEVHIHHTELGGAEERRGWMNSQVEQFQLCVGDEEAGEECLRQFKEHKFYFKNEFFTSEQCEREN